MTPTPEMIEAAAKAIGRTRTGLDDDDSDLCDASCETGGGTCICVELHYDQAQAALSAALAVMWQPIETAPKDQHIFAGHVEHRWIRFAKWYDVMWYYSGTNERSQYAQVRGDDPTHWMPLPDPPKETA